MKISSLPLYISTIAVFSTILLLSCCDDKEMMDPDDLSDIPYNPIVFEPTIPAGFPALEVPADNLLTIEGVELGRRLFHDPILSVDSSLSCNSCHLLNGNFTDNEKFSEGVDGIEGMRSSMTLLNVGFANTGLFWDGRVNTLEEQALLPVEDPIELHASWPEVITKLKKHSDYKQRFRKAFGIGNVQEIDRELVAKALAQFERIIISSGESKYDRVIAGTAVFTDLELDGHDIFFDINEDVTSHAECGHCHNAPLFTTNEYFNNGIDEVVTLEDFEDKGRGIVTMERFDFGTFKVPTLRNIELSAPFMHDGRFSTLDEVIDHYVSGGHGADNLAPVLRPLNLSEYDRSALKSFIQTLADPALLENPMLTNPFK